MNVSILIPVYNCSEYIGAAIESVLAQTFQNFEIIVVDDGSEDETASVVKTYKEVQYIYQPHQGVAVARNRALQEASGKWISFLDADDLILPSKLEKQIAYLEMNPECEIVFCEYQNFLETDLEKTTISQKLLMEKPTHRHQLIGALVDVRLFQKWGGFNVRLKYGENREWVTGIRAAGVDIKHCVDGVLYLRRIHMNNTTLHYTQIDREDLLRIFASSIRRSRREIES